MPKGVYERSEKEKIRGRNQVLEFAKNRIGTHLSNETKRKIGEKNKISIKELWKNEEYRKNQLEKLKPHFDRNVKEMKKRKGKTIEEIYGKEEAERIRTLISITGKGRIPINKGKTTEELYGKKRALEIREINVKSHSGKKASEETKKKMREWIKVNNPHLGKKFPKELYPNMGLRKTRQNIIMPIKDSKIELKTQNFLKELNIDFFTHHMINQIKHRYQCDIWIPSKNLVIECDGDYWHSYPTGREIDKIRTSELIEKGFKVLRLWERDIKVMDIDRFHCIVSYVNDLMC